MPIDRERCFAQQLPFGQVVAGCGHVVGYVDRVRQAALLTNEIAFGATPSASGASARDPGAYRSAVRYRVAAASRRFSLISRVTSGISFLFHPAQP